MVKPLPNTNLLSRNTKRKWLGFKSNSNSSQIAGKFKERAALTASCRTSFNWSEVSCFVSCAFPTHFQSVYDPLSIRLRVNVGSERRRDDCKIVKLRNFVGCGFNPLKPHECAILQFRNAASVKNCPKCSKINKVNKNLHKNLQMSDFFIIFAGEFHERDNYTWCTPLADNKPHVLIMHIHY